jgi:hypothetical protein
MADSNLARQHRLSQEQPRADQTCRRGDHRRRPAMLSTGLKIATLSSPIDRATREERSNRLRALLDRISREKAEAITRIEDCPFPKYATEKEDWRQELEMTDVTGPDGAQALTSLLMRVREYRTAADANGFDSSIVRTWIPAVISGTGRESLLSALRRRTPYDEMTHVMLNASLVLIELQLMRLIDLCAEWYKA